MSNENIELNNIENLRENNVNENLRENNVDENLRENNVDENLRENNVDENLRENNVDENENYNHESESESENSCLNDNNILIVKKNCDKILSENLLNSNINNQNNSNNITYQSYKKIGIKINKNKYNNEIIVEKVISGSIADKKGIIKNDIILSLNELDIEHLSINQVNNILNSENFENMQMCLKRKGFNSKEDEFYVNFDDIEYNNRSISESENVHLRSNITKNITIPSESKNSYKSSANNILNNYKLMKSIEDYCIEKRDTHWLSSKYYEKKNNMFVIPSIFITALSGILAFLASSEYIDNNNKVILSLIVGCFASLSSLIQSFSNAYSFSNKAESHQDAVESYDQILTKVKFHKINSGPEIDTIFLNNVKDQISETKQRTKFLVPQDIEDKYFKKKHEVYINNMLYKAEERATKIKSSFYYKKLKYMEEWFDNMYDKKINILKNNNNIETDLNKIEEGNIKNSNINFNELISEMDNKNIEKELKIKRNNTIKIYGNK